MLNYRNLRPIFAIEQALLVLLLGGMNISSVVLPKPAYASANPSSQLKSIIEDAIALIDSQKYQQALAKLQQAQQLAQQEKDTGNIPAISFYIGQAYQGMGQLDLAIENYQTALATAPNIGNVIAEYNLTIAIFYAVIEQENSFENLNYSKVLQIVDHVESATAKLSPEARKTVESTIRTHQFRAMLVKSSLYRFQGEYRKAMTAIETAWTIAQTIDVTSEIPILLRNKSLTLSAMGQYNAALEVAEDIRKRCIQLQVAECQINSLQTLADIKGNLGRGTEAIALLQEGLKIARQQRLNDGTIERLLSDLGIAYLYAKNYTAAKQTFLQANQLNVTARNAYHLAHVSQELQQYAEAEKYYQQALTLAQKDNQRQIEVRASQGLATLYATTDRINLSLELFQRALKTAQASQDKKLESIILGHQGKAFAQLDRLPEAESSLRSAIDIMESLRRPLNDTNKISFNDSFTVFYQVLQSVLIKQNKPNEALEIAERGRARALVDLLASKLTSSLSIQNIQKTPDFNQIKAIAQQQNATLVEYSILPDDQLYIWVISPSGKINFQVVSLDSQNLKKLFKKLVTILSKRKRIIFLTI
jgi:tetratricopeptide (TPR) repeat protein